MIKKFSIGVLCIGFLAMSFATLQQWTIADNSNAAFTIKAAIGTVKGTIGGLKGTVNFDPVDLIQSNMDVTLDVKTIHTGITKRDKDLLDEEVWFDAAKYPKIAFKSDHVIKTATGFNVDGTLTIKSTSKKVEIPFTFDDPTGVAGTFTGSLTLNRLDYRVGKSTVMVKDTVLVTITVPVKKQ